MRYNPLMTNLKNSIMVLFFYLIAIFGIAQVNYIEENILNFEKAFFILVAVSVLGGIYFSFLARLSFYIYLPLWTLIYGLVWYFYWRNLPAPLHIQILGIQYLLIMISASLAYEVGRRLDSLNRLFEGLSASTYPNRVMELQKAEDRISAELTRSRRYQRSLSLLIVELDRKISEDTAKPFEGLQNDLLQRFAAARVGQIIGERARETDLLLRDRRGRFLLLCPETDDANSVLFGERIRRAVSDQVGAGVRWGFASFPNDALTFDELIEFAENRLEQGEPAREKAQEEKQDILV